MARKLQIEWHEDAETLNAAYRKAKDGQDRQRLHALWLLRQGKSMAETAELGTVSGDISGSLETRLLSISQAGKILHVEFDWIVDAGEQSFTARLKGTLDSETGTVTMNGTVFEGYLAGAQVHEQGQLVNPATSGFEGTIRLMPASAD
jgi:hypothetical protein